MRIVVSILLLGLAASVPDDEARVFVGEVVAVSHDNLQLRRNESITSIGFVGDPAVLARLHRLNVGEEVRAVFGSTPRAAGPGRINKLISIRRCEKNDALCAADGRIQDAKHAEAKKARVLSQEKMAQCRVKMEQTLLKDSRYAPQTTKIQQIQSQENLRKVNALTGARQECATAVMNDHRNAVVEACELHRCGVQIGGGCSHIAGYSLSDAAIERALVACKGK